MGAGGRRLPRLRRLPDARPTGRSRCSCWSPQRRPDRVQRWSAPARWAPRPRRPWRRCAARSPAAAPRSRRRTAGAGCPGRPAPGWRPTSSTRSPARSPACAAGLPPITSASRSPLLPAVPVGHRGRHRRRGADHAQVGPAHPALGEQRRHDPPGGRVHRHRQPEPDPGHRRVDPDHPAARVGERAAGVARVERGVGLDHVLDHPAGAAAAGGQGPAERADHARRSPSRPARAGCPPPPPAGRRPARRRCPGAPARAARRPARRAARPGPTAGRRRPRATSTWRPSTKSARPRRAEPTTCALVTRTPSPGTTTAEPLPRPVRTAATRPVISAATALTVRE